jgi:hypothetical protein
MIALFLPAEGADLVTESRPDTSRLDAAADAYAEAKRDLDAMMAAPFEQSAYETAITNWRAALVRLERAAMARPKPEPEIVT